MGERVKFVTTTMTSLALEADPPVPVAVIVYERLTWQLREVMREHGYPVLVSWPVVERTSHEMLVPKRRRAIGRLLERWRVLGERIEFAQVGWQYRMSAWGAAADEIDGAGYARAGNGDVWAT